MQAPCARAVVFLLLSLPCDRNCIPVRVVGCGANVRLWTAAGACGQTDGGAAAWRWEGWRSNPSGADRTRRPLSPLSLCPSRAVTARRRVAVVRSSAFRLGDGGAIERPASVQRRKQRRWFPINSLQRSAVRCDAISGAIEADSDGDDEPAGWLYMWPCDSRPSDERAGRIAMRPQARRQTIAAARIRSIRTPCDHTTIQIIQAASTQS